MSNTAQASAMERINLLLDENSFVEIGAKVTKRSTDFNLQEKSVPGDGVITGYGVIDGNIVYVYSQDSSALGGSIGEMHAKKIITKIDLDGPVLCSEDPIIGGAVFNEKNITVSDEPGLGIKGIEPGKIQYL